MAAGPLATSSSSGALVGGTEATEFGAAIRDMRLAHNADLETVAAALRIRLVYLQAIEDGRFSDLPGPTYAAGFVRAYAEYLGLELSEVMRRYREVALGSDRQAPLVAPSPVVEGTMPTGFILLVAAVLAAIAYGSWSYITLNGRDTGDIVAQLPKQIADIVGLEAGTPETPAQQPEAAITAEPTVETVEQAGDLAGTQSAAETPAPLESQQALVPDEAPTVVVQTKEDPVETTVDVVSSAQANPQISQALQVTTPRPSEMVSEVEAARETVEVVRGAPRVNPEINAAGEGPTAQFEPLRILTVPPSVGSDPVQVAGVPDATQSAVLPSSPPDFVVPEQASRVVLRATEISWVELRDGSGKRVFSRLLKKGETYNVPGKSGITLATGNAGALDVLVDGQTIGPLGPAGAVRRNVLLEPAALLQRLNARQ